MPLYRNNPRLRMISHERGANEARSLAWQPLKMEKKKISIGNSIWHALFYYYPAH